MKNKLTVLIDEENISFAKKFAKENNSSVSKLLDDFLLDLKKAKSKRKISYDPYIQKYAGYFKTGYKSMEDIFGDKKS